MFVYYFEVKIILKGKKKLYNLFKELMYYYGYNYNFWLNIKYNLCIVFKLS